ncbi:MAG: histidine phosphotransferase family protein [Caulobacteraceae bacterium]
MSESIPHHELAARLAARLCHDFVGPAGAVVSGLDLWAGSEAEDLRGAALEMVDAGARRLLAAIAFSRAAYGVGDEVFDSGALGALARGVFADLRPTLEWAVTAPALPGPAARTLLNLVQMAADALALGGTARAWAEPRGGKTHLGVEAVGPRAKTHPEVLAGLGGEGRGEGLSGRWVQAYFVHAMVAAAGGKVAVQPSEAGIAFTAILP